MLRYIWRDSVLTGTKCTCFALFVLLTFWYIQGAGTTESTLTEIFASRSNTQIKALSEAYLAGKDLTQCVCNFLDRQMLFVQRVWAIFFVHLRNWKVSDLWSEVRGIWRLWQSAAHSGWGTVQGWTMKNEISFKDTFLNKCWITWPDYYTSHKALCLSSQGKRDETTNVDAAKARADAKVQWQCYS